MTNEIPNDVKIQLLEQELRNHQSALYLLKKRAEAAEFLGKKDVQEAALKDVEAQLKFIDFYGKEIAELKQQNKE